MDRPIWLMSNPRSGSNYLAALLTKAANLESHITEKFHGVPPNSEINKNYFWNTTIHWHQFKYMSFSINQICEIYEDIFFVELIRNNIYAKAVSLYFAKSTNIYVNLTQDSWWLRGIVNPWIHREPDLPSLPTLNSDLLIECYRQTLHEHNQWEKTLPPERTIRITYENLICDTHCELKKILKTYGKQVSDQAILRAIQECPVKKTTRPELEEYMKILKSLI